MVGDYQKFLVKYSEVLVLVVVGNQDIDHLDVADKVAADTAVVDMDVADKVAVGRAVVGRAVVGMDVVDKVAVDTAVDKVMGMEADRNYQAVFLYLQQ